MQLEHFRFRDIYLETSDERFDLHNCFDFSGLAYDVSARALTLVWKPNEFHPRQEQPHIHVKFRDVSHFSIEPRDADLPFTEDECLSFVAYASPDSEVGEALNCERPGADMHIVFCFMSGIRVRVYAARAYVELKAAP